MPPKKKGAKKAVKSSPRAKKAAEDDEMDQEEEAALLEDNQEEADDSMNDADVNGQVKRKAEDDDSDEEEESSSKKQKTEDDDDEEEEEDKPEKVSLFCGNLDPDMSATTLKGFFESQGIEVLDARKSDRKRFGYIDVEPEYEEEVLALNGKELNGSEIRIDKAKPKGALAQEKPTNPRDDKTLFVKNLTENVTEDSLRDFFSPADIDEIRLPKKRDGLCKGFGYVVFETIEAMEEQLKDKQGTELDGQQIFLDYTNDKSSHVSIQKKGLRGFTPSKVIFVRNLSFDVTEDELKEHFPGCDATRIPTNPHNDRPKGFAFVEFSSVDDAVSAQKEKDGLEINGRSVQLAFATDKESDGGGRRRGGGGGGWGGGGGRRGGGGWGGGGGGWGGGGGGGRWGGGGGGWGGGGGGWGGGGGGWGGGGGRGGGRGGGGRGRGGGGRGGGRGGGFKKRW